MIQSPQSYSVYANAILAKLQQTGITQTAPGGIARAYSDIMGSQIAALETTQFNNLLQTLVPFATKDSLDYLGQIYGVPRIGQQNASSTSGDENFEFYVNSGTFGSINNGQNIVVPAGTQIFTSNANGPVFVTTSTITLDAGSSSQYFNVTALSLGSVANAGASAYTQTNFTNYANAVFGSLLVTNNYGIISGRDTETDDDYRFRIQLSLQSKGGSAQTDLQLALLDLPGIQNVVFQAQAGTFYVYIYSIASNISPVTLQLAQAAIDAATAYPLSGKAIAPTLIGISLNTSLTLAPGLTAAAQNAIVTQVVSAAANYINNLDVGDTLFINQLASVIEGASPNILTIGTPDHPIQSISIWRQRADGTSYSRALVEDYAPAVGERIVVQNITNAISITVN